MSSNHDHQHGNASGPNYGFHVRNQIFEFMTTDLKSWRNRDHLGQSQNVTRSKMLKKALDLKSVDILNDVSGLRCEKMQDLVKESNIEAVFMHSLSVPADKKNIVSFNQDVVSYILNWAKSQLDKLINIGISKDKLIFDPGIGFGNNSLQALQLMSRFKEFKQLDIKLFQSKAKNILYLFGHIHFLH